MAKKEVDIQEKAASMKMYTVYNVKDIAAQLGIAERTVLNYIRRGELKAKKVGHKWLVTEDNLKKFLES